MMHKAAFCGRGIVRVLAIIAFVCVIALSTAMGQAASSEPAVSDAPVNPRFLERQNVLINGFADSNVTIDGHTLGYQPSPIDYSHLMNQPAPQTSVVLPSSYDLRAYGRVTAVRDQGSCGSCWAFGTFGSLESVLLTGETRDFSENNLKNLHGFDWTPCYGGNADMATAYLARWDGPINETDDPYSTSNTSNSPLGLKPQKHLQNTIIIAGRGSALNNDALKNAVMTYGAVDTFMYWDDASYKASTASYYYSGTSSFTNHSVTLVGWDDNYPASNFNTAPAGNGAFLIKNSWGTYWGNAGYFWISYYDVKYAMTAASVVFVGNEPATNYTRNYQYDPLGPTSGIGYGSTTAWFANVFTAADNEDLKAVATFAVSDASPYVVNIYTGVTSSPTTGTLAGTTSGTFTNAGYHTVVLPTPVALTRGQAFSVVMQLTTPNYNYPVPVEKPIAGYSTQANAASGQSYISSSGTSWSDLTKFVAKGNAALKAFTTDVKAAMSMPAPGSLLPGSSVNFTWSPGLGATEYWLSIGTTAGGTDLYNQSQALNTSATVNGLPTGGTTVYVRLKTMSSGNWIYNDYVYATGTNAALTNPTPGSTLPGSSVNFSWTPSIGGVRYWMWIGTTLGGMDLYNQDQMTNTGTLVNGLPLTGATIYVRLFTQFASGWQSTDYTYTAAVPGKAVMTSPASGSTLPGPTVTFGWAPGVSAQRYWMWIGTTAGGMELYNQDQNLNTAATVNGLPMNGSTVYVRLFTVLNGAWQYNDYTYTAATPSKAAMMNPSPSSSLTGSNVTFSWQPGVGATQYWLWIGKTFGVADIYNQSQGMNTSVTVNGLPIDGSTLYVRLFTVLNGGWQWNDYTYTAAAPTKAAMLTPAPSSALTSTSVNFSWDPGVGATQYWLWVGKSLGVADLYNQGQGMNTSATVSGLPMTGATLYVRLFTVLNGGWQWNDYTYTAPALTKASMLLPTPSSTLPGSSVTFNWSSGIGATQYWMWIGTTAGGMQLYNQGQGLNTSATVTGLPTNSSTIYVRLFTVLNGAWQWNDYTYAASGTSTGVNNSELSGHYAFMLRGFDPGTTVMRTLVGSFNADANGNITGGMMDGNNTSGAPISQTITGGSYTVGSDQRGTLTLTTSLGTWHYAIALGSISSGVAQSGRLIRTDLNRPITGVLKKQDTSAFSNSAINGNFTFNLSGLQGNGRFVAVGVINFDGAGHITASLDQSEGGVVNGGSPSPLSFSGTYNVTDATNGRATFVNTTQGANMVFYIVSANEAFLTEVDQFSPDSGPPTFTGSAVKQSGTFTNAALSGANVFAGQSGAMGCTSWPITASWVGAGVVNFDGSGNLTGEMDQNDHGQVAHASLAGTYSVASNGRVSLNINGPEPMILYLSAPGKAVGMGTDECVTELTFRPQSGGPFTNASLSGTYTFGTEPPVTSNSGVDNGTVYIDGAGNISGTSDQNDGSGPSSGPIVDTYSVLPNGRMVMSENILYLISPTKAVMINSKSGQESPTVHWIEK